MSANSNVRSYKLKTTNAVVPVKANKQDNSLTFNFALPATATVDEKKVKAVFTVGKTAITRKVRLFGKVVRNTSREPVLASVQLPSVTLVLHVGSEKFNARSVCKPPDVFNVKMGMKLALHRLFKQPLFKEFLEDTDYEVLMKVLLTKPPTLSQIARIEKRTQKV